MLASHRGVDWPTRFQRRPSIPEGNLIDEPVASESTAGPVLTAARRCYSMRDPIDQVINPSKVINEQCPAVTVITADGLAHTGIVVTLNGDR